MQTEGLELLTERERMTVRATLQELEELTGLKLRSFRVINTWANGISYDYDKITIGLDVVRETPTESCADHSVAWCNNRIEALIRHEFGHCFHQCNDDKIAELIPYRPDWNQAYGITTRARDHYGECIAENFALWSTGHTVHGDLQQAFSQLCGCGGKHEGRAKTRAVR